MAGPVSELKLPKSVASEYINEDRRKDKVTEGLVLPGYACTAQIWNPIRDRLGKIHDITWVDWPHDVTTRLETVSAYADWLYPVFKRGNFDFIIGHSMGGLIALELAKRDNGLLRNVILVETFLQTPSPFFRNFFMESTPAEIAQPVLDMLDREKPHYSSRLKETLKQDGIYQLDDEVRARLHAIHGDRGNGNLAEVRKELDWSEYFQQRVQVSVIENTCHFPMVENPEKTVQTILDIIE